MDCNDVAAIKAAQGVYRAADVARAYGVHPSTVTRIWDGQSHADIRPAPDFPDIPVQYRPRDLADDIHIMLERGMSVNEVAQLLNIHRSSVYRVVLFL